MAKQIKKWNSSTVSDMRQVGWQLIEADVWASPNNKQFSICFQDGTMASGYFPGKEPRKRRKEINIGTWIDQN